MISRALGIVACSIAWTAMAAAVELQAAGLDGFEAVYRIEYDGKEAGTMTTSLSHNTESGSFVYTSTTSWKGLFARIMPGPVQVRSEFNLVDGDVLPISYTVGEDGNSSKRDVRFDWESLHATVSTREQSDLVTLQPGMLDPGSAYVALLLASPRPGTSWRSQILEDTAVSDYEYDCTGEDELETTHGRTTTRIVSQQRPGSTRRSLFWLSPVAGSPPYRIEQQKNGATEVTFVLVAATHAASIG